MLGFLGALTLRTNKPAYAIGERPVYTIQGGTPGALIAWTSFKNGVATGEYQSSYAQVIGEDGTAVLTGEPWTSATIGQWQKQVIVFEPSNIQNTAQVSFTVGSVAASSDSGSSIFSGSIDVLGVQVPSLALLLGLGFTFFIFTKK